MLEDEAKADLEGLAASWQVSLATVLREAAHDFLKRPHPPKRSPRLPGRKPSDPELAAALHRLRLAGAQPSQIARARVANIRADAIGSRWLDLPHVGRFKNLSIELVGEVRDAVGVVIGWGRGTSRIGAETPLLVNGDGEPWSAVKIGRVMNRGKQLAATSEEPTNDQGDRREMDRG